MPMPAAAKFALMLGEPAWQRAAFDADTALVDGVVQLSWDALHEGTGGTPTAVADTAGAGLAFDAQCRLFHSVPQDHRVERWLWHAMDPGRPQHSPPPSDVLLDHLSAPQVLGALPRVATGFAPSSPAVSTFTPRALACDEDGNLYVLDTVVRRVWIVDVAQRRVQRSEPVPADAVHIAWFGAWLWVLCSSGVLQRLAATRVPQAAPVTAHADSSRLAFAPDGRLFVLLRAHAADASVLLLGRAGHWLTTPQVLSFAGDNPFAFASGLAVSVDGDGQPQLVVARRPEELFTRVDVRSDGNFTLLEPLAARHYDGAGIAATPDGRIVFFTPGGPRHATGARLHYRSRGRVVGFRLDAGQPQASWGRLLLDACLPANTLISVHCLISDDDIEGPRLHRTAPANQPLVTLLQPEATPLPLVNTLPADDTQAQLLFKRTDGSEQPWLVEQERFDTFEGIAPATLGRYLWLVFDLQGHSRATPRLRGVRAETPAHDWLRRLPLLYSRQDAMRSFLQRLLAPMAGLEADVAAQSDERHALLKPCSTPAAALPWLARWVGLTLDERWSDTARRSFIKEAPWLFRLRGTLWSLRRMVEIVTGARVVIVEQFRMRGLARVGAGSGAVSGEGAGPAWDEPAVLGMGMRVGGPVGNDSVQGVESEISDSFALNAHRFAVLVQAELNAVTEAAVRHLLEVHRPAHTLFTLCALGQGARIGRGLQIGLSTVVGPVTGFAQLQLGAATLGRGQLLGSAPQAQGAMRPGPSRLGQTSRIS